MRTATAVLCLALGLAACAETSDVAWPPPGPLAPGCVLTPRAVLPLAVQRNFMLAPVDVDGQTVTMVVDTGAESTAVTPLAVKQLRLRGDHGRGSVMRGVGGDVRSRDVRAHELALGGHVMLKEPRLDVGDLPPFPGITPPVSGLLGTDVLAAGELELDAPAHRMALYAATGCAGYVPWPGAVARPFQRTRSGLMFIDAVIEGHTVHALLDTGARTTQITPDVAAVLGVSPATLAGEAANTGVGIGMARFSFRRHRFASVGLPGDLERDMPVDIAAFNLPGVEMLLGADYLGARHVWISYATGRLFLRR